MVKTKWPTIQYPNPNMSGYWMFHVIGCPVIGCFIHVKLSSTIFPSLLYIWWALQILKVKVKVFKIQIRLFAVKKVFFPGVIISNFLLSTSFHWIVVDRLATAYCNLTCLSSPKLVKQYFSPRLTLYNFIWKKII
jgi:hypothetical protein